MEQLLPIATVLVAVVSGLTEAIKATGTVNTKYLPLLTLVIGILTGALASTLFDVELVKMMWAGAIAGLASCGLYDGIVGIKE